MSRHFVGTTTDGSVEIDVSPITTFPLTVSAWVWPQNANVFKEVVNISDKDDPNNWLARLALTQTGVVRCYSRDGAVNDGEANTSTSYTALTWHHICGTFTSVGRSAFLNGGGKGSNAVAKTPTGVDRLAIGRAGDSTPSDPMTGWIAEVVIWNSVLTDQQIFRLGQGHDPYDIGARPYLYFPMGRGTEIDGVRGTILRPVGTLSYPAPCFRPSQLKYDHERSLWRFMDVPPGGGGPTAAQRFPAFLQSLSGNVIGRVDA